MNLNNIHVKVTTINYSGAVFIKNVQLHAYNLFCDRDKNGKEFIELVWNERVPRSNTQVYLMIYLGHDRQKLTYLM